MVYYLFHSSPLRLLKLQNSFLLMVPENKRQTYDIMTYIKYTYLTFANEFNS